MKKVLVIVAILVAAAACGGTTGTAISNTSRSTDAVAPQPSTGSTSGAPTQYGGQNGSGTTKPPVLDVVPVPGPQVIRQAQLAMSVTSGSFDSKLSDVRSLVEQEQGFIAGTDAQTNPVSNDQIRSGVISFMVPAAKFDETIDKLSKFGKVQNEHISGQDVSAQFVDLHSRLANEEAQRNAMLALLARAQTISDIISVQNQLGQITGQIEQLKGQIAYIEHNTAYSQVTVNITEAGAPAQTASVDSWGFASALSGAAHNFVTTINYVITGLGAIGPIVVLLGLGYLGWRRLGPRVLRRA